MKSIFFIILTFSLNAMAQDPNFLTPADLPKTTYQIYSESGRPPVPNFPEHYGEADALRANLGEDYCHSKVGQQLTPWVHELTGDTVPRPFAQYTYTVSATFACLPPTLSATMSDEKSAMLFNAIPIIAKMSGNDSTKKANVLCYDSLEEVCNSNVLQGYNEYLTCEIVDLDDLSATSLIDEDKEDGSRIVRGARVLNDLLPIYRDTRSDGPHTGPNCSPVALGRLKGLERKAATITCDKRSGKVSCKVEGIIH